MRKLFVTKDAPLHLDDRGILGLELFDKEFCGDLWVYQVPASEDIYCGIAVFRPRVDGKVDSAMTTIPLMPKGLNSWKATSTIVAFASNAAFLSVSLTNSRFVRVLGLQSLNSNNRWVPNACNLFASFSARRTSSGIIARSPRAPPPVPTGGLTPIPIRLRFRRRPTTIKIKCHLSKILTFVKDKMDSASFFSRACFLLVSRGATRSIFAPGRDRDIHFFDNERQKSGYAERFFFITES